MMDEKEKKSGARVPRGLPISGVICLILGFIALRVIPNTFTEEQLANNVIISAIPFVLIFASIIIFYMSFVWWVSVRLGGSISEKVYRPIEYVLIGGIVLGAVMMFQPWVFLLYQVGFFMLLFALIGYIIWSHVRPRDDSRFEELPNPAE